MVRESADRSRDDLLLLLLGLIVLEAARRATDLQAWCAVAGAEYVQRVSTLPPDVDRQPE